MRTNIWQILISLSSAILLVSLNVIEIANCQINSNEENLKNEISYKKENEIYLMNENVKGTLLTSHTQASSGGRETSENTRPIRSANLNLNSTGAGRGNKLFIANQDDTSSSISMSPAKRKLLLKSTPSMLNSAVINGKVNLACDISPASQDDSVALILWYKDDSLAPIYTLDARKEPSLDRAKVTIDEAYSGRASFLHSNKPAQLQLESIRLDDEGEYRCRVDFKRGRTVNTIISLRVVVPPSDLRIVDPNHPSQKLEGLIGPFNEGTELVLLCLADGGKPRPQISWRRDFNVIDETYQHLDKDGTSNELKIPSLSKNHLLSIFTCQANNNSTQTPLETSITLDLNLKPQEILIRQIGSEPLVVGQTATFECLTSGSRPQASIYWLFQGRQHTQPTESDQQRSSSRLTLSLQRSFNQETLTCVAENTRMPSQQAQSNSLRQSIKLDVHYPPQVSVKLESPTSQRQAQQQQQQQQEQPDTGTDTTGNNQQQLVQEGNDIYLSCQMEANPRPTKQILWRFNGKLLSIQSTQQQQSSSSSIVMNNQSLVLRKVSRRQSGLYSCESSNQHGTNTSQPIELIVRHAPVCLTDDILIFEASIGHSIPIECLVQANPSSSVHFSWFKSPNEQGSLSDLIQRDVALDEQMDNASKKLELKVKDQSAFGLYKCRAKNEIGIQNRPCLFQVIEAQPPKLHHSCRLHSSTAISIQIDCKPSELLKTEEFEFSAPASPASPAGVAATPTTATSSASNVNRLFWPLNFDGSQGSRNDRGGINNKLDKGNPRFRSIYPPRWLLVELYKMSTDGNTSESEAELVAYVIVANPDQLLNIKSIVETSKLFAFNPKSVYYVKSMTTNQSQSEQIFNQDQLVTNQIVKFRPDLQILPSQSSTSSGSSSSATSMFQSTQSYSLNISNQDVTLQNQFVEEDPTIRLASHFSFVIPSLEPETNYKLLIFAQNLANKTRDWLVIKAQTLHDDGSGSIGSGHNMRHGHSPFNVKQQQQHNDREQTSNNQASQKSIVMRSDSEQQADSYDPSYKSGDSNEPNRTRQASWMSSGGGFTMSIDARWPQRFQTILTNYTDRAIIYTRQRPLVALPLMLVCSICLLFTLIWFVGHIRHMVRRQSSPRENRQASHSSPTSDVSTDSTYKSAAVSNETHGNGIVTHCHQNNEKCNKAMVFTTSCSGNSHSTSAYSAVSAGLSDYSGYRQNDDIVNKRAYLPDMPSHEHQTSHQRQQEQQHFWPGSLDRRTVIQHPIYVTTTCSDFEHPSNRYDSIDRFQWQIPQDSETFGMKKRTIKSGNQTTSRSNQRVAFNLSPYDDHNGTQHLDIHHRHPLYKGSDSSGTNSNNTADSGHESPPTNGTSNTTLTANNIHLGPDSHQCADQITLVGAPQPGTYIVSSSLGSSVACSPAISELIQFQPNSDQSNLNQSEGLLMLMESSDTIGLPVNLNHLKNNHQMATSFCSSPTDRMTHAHGQYDSSEVSQMYSQVYRPQNQSQRYRSNNQRQARESKGDEGGYRNDEAKDIENWL